MKHVLAIGVFDLFHVGHLRYLQFARRQGELLSVAVWPDALVLHGKGATPVIAQEQRLEMLRGLGWIDHVTLLPVSTEEAGAAAAWIAACGIDCVAAGGEWRGSARWSRLGAALAERQIAVIFAPHTPGISSTLIAKSIREQSGTLTPRA